MKRVEAAHRFGVSAERGFAFITDTANWPRFWPGYVRLEEGSRWGAARDTAGLVLTMRITNFELNRLVTYTSTQPGLPDASHERQFEPDHLAQPCGCDADSSSDTHGLGDPLPIVVHVATLEAACHAGGRGFESRRSRLEDVHIQRRLCGAVKDDLGRRVALAPAASRPSFRGG
jgi:hypothetical protein